MSFNPDFGSEPFLSKAQIMTSSLSGKNDSSVNMTDGGNFEILVPILPRDAVIFGQFVYWEAVSAIVEVHYGGEVLFESVPPGCGENCDGLVLEVPAALDSFFQYNDEGCLINEQLIDCPAPDLSGKGDQFQTAAGSEFRLSWDIQYADERFSPFDPRLVLARQGRLYSETLLHK